MFSLVVGFFAQMNKRAASAQGETTPGYEVSGGKCLRRSDPDEEAQKSPIVITLHHWRIGSQLGGFLMLLELRGRLI